MAVRNPTFQKVDWVNLGMSGVAVLVTFLFFSFRAVVGVASGALLMTGNFFILRILAATMFGPRKNAKMLALAFLMCKFVFLFGATYVALRLLSSHVVAFVAGVVLISLTTAFVAAKTETAEEGL